MASNLKRASFKPTLVCLLLAIGVFLYARHLANPNGYRWEPLHASLKTVVSQEQIFKFDVDFSQDYLVDFLLPPQTFSKDEFSSYSPFLNIGEKEKFFPVKCEVSLDGKPISKTRAGWSSSSSAGIAFGCATFRGEPKKEYQLTVVVTEENGILNRALLAVIVGVHPMVYKDNIVSAQLAMLGMIPFLIIAVVLSIRPVFHIFRPPRAD